MNTGQQAGPSAATAGGLGQYQPAPGAYDEVMAAPGSPRPHWLPLLERLSGLGPEEWATRRDTVGRLLRERGVTYNVYTDAHGRDRPWELDLLPVIIPAAEWARLEAGLRQRARLLNALLADLYGPQRLLREGKLPPALVQANPAFVRPCHGWAPPRDQFLFFYAADLARLPDGTWCVLADRTQAPSGAGYALENRITLARVFEPEARECRVQRLAGFFQAQRDTLRALRTAGGETGQVVLLTPGPRNEAYFEHAFLARYLGFPLVEGGDLTVRERRVYVKTLEGLQPVSALVRRVDDLYCDPVELRADSSLGVPGFLEAARAGNIILANAAGAGLVETPAWLPFLPGLCQDLLGEELRLPSVPTWWCGQAAACDQVLERLGQLVVKRAFGPPAAGAATAAELEGALRQTPFDFVAQQQIVPSRIPAWTGDRFGPRPMVLRAYGFAEGETYRIMPGGLTRVLPTPEPPVVLMQRGGASKDTWVLADGPIAPTTLLRPITQVVRPERIAAEVPTRVADNLFWLGRYAERLEDAARILRRALGTLAAAEGLEPPPGVVALVQLLVRLDLLPAWFGQTYTLPALEKEVFLVIYQLHRVGTIREVAGRLHHLAFVLRDRFSTDTWRILTQLHADAGARPGRLPGVEALALLNRLIVDLAAFSGMEMENMTRGHGWRFLDLGRRLERARNVVALCHGALAVEGAGQWLAEPLLDIADSLMTYRRRYFAQPELPPVLDLILADETNPRSLAFQLNALAEHTTSLPPGGDGSAATQAAQLVASSRQRLREMNLPTLAAGGSTERTAELGRCLAALEADLRNLSDTINHHYFTHAAARVT